MDTRLKIAAVLAWASALALTFLTDLDPGQWATSLTVVCAAAAACITACVVMRSCARSTRRAVYHQRRWDDTPEATVLQLMRQPDAVDRAAQRTVASRSSTPTPPMVKDVQHPHSS